MKVSPELETRVAAWLDATATADGSEEVLAAALHEASRVPQERTRGSDRPPSLHRWARPLVVAASLGTAVMVVAVTAIPPVPETASARVTGVWPTGPDVAFTAELSPDAPRDIYWRATSFDEWSGAGPVWRVSDGTSTSIDAGGSILDVAHEPVPTTDLHEITATITGGRADTLVVSPGMPLRLDQAAEVETTGPGGPLVQVSLASPARSYRVTGLQGDEWQPAAGSTEAASDYPADIQAKYAQAPAPGELGHSSIAFLEAVRASAGDDPNRLAVGMVEAFRDPRFKYVVDTRNIDCGSDGFTECFLRVKRGYCMYFATAMIMLLRHEGIPARFVLGYLPGERIGSVETVRMQAAHAWVEVFFPGRGWISFDPTPARAVPEVVPATTP